MTYWQQICLLLLVAVAIIRDLCFSAVKHFFSLGCWISSSFHKSPPFILYTWILESLCVRLFLRMSTINYFLLLSFLFFFLLLCARFNFSKEFHVLNLNVISFSVLQLFLLRVYVLVLLKLCTSHPTSLFPFTAVRTVWKAYCSCSYRA